MPFSFNLIFYFILFYFIKIISLNTNMSFIPKKAINSEFFKSKFEKGVVSGKVGLVIVLLILAYVNKDSRYVGDNPRFFMSNNMAIAVSSAIATGFMAWNRGSGIFQPVFISFLFFFFFQVVRQLSGWYAFVGDEKMTEKEEKEKKPLIILSAILGLICGVFFINLIFKIREGPPTNMKYKYPIECIIFAIILAIGELVVGKTHGQEKKHMYKSAIISVIMFVSVSIGLQYGGFYQHVFKPSK